MRLLLDTHALLWWLGDMPQLGPKARACIAQGENDIYVSAASVWEIEIMRAIGKLQAPDDLADAVAASHFEPLPITLPHAIAAGRLPQHHSDPFDRMLIAQALSDELCVVTKDAAFQKYEIALLESHV
ncbi:MAG TPA: type II toxin-antitoxin system VapC family toxin [Gammaproteobacteria bacterium]|nr:type II toxin-antitoxin system VapC family toxin [Gammaproteobacteria bacterium]